MDSQVTRRSLLLCTSAVALGFTGRSANSAQTAKPVLETGSIEKLCTAYLNAWSAKDLDAIAACLHPAVQFSSPTARTEGRDAYLAATKRVLPLLQGIDVRAQFVSGERALFAYDFVCREPIGVSRTAELVRVEDGLIRESEVFFDARPFEAFARAQAARAGSK